MEKALDGSDEPFTLIDGRIKVILWKYHGDGDFPSVAWQLKIMKEECMEVTPQFYNREEIIKLLNEGIKFIILKKAEEIKEEMKQKEGGDWVIFFIKSDANLTAH